MGCFTKKSRNFPVEGPQKENKKEGEPERGKTKRREKIVVVSKVHPRGSNRKRGKVKFVKGSVGAYGKEEDLIRA